MTTERDQATSAEKRTPVDKSGHSYKALVEALREIERECRPDWSIDDEERVTNIKRIARAALSRARGEAS